MQSFYLTQKHLAPIFLMNRKYLLPLSLLLLIFALAACGSGEDFSAPDQPNLSLQAGEQSDSGLRTVACWPKGEKNVSCEFTTDADSPNPSSALVLQGGQAVTVVIANPEGVALPNQVVITSRETDAAGNPMFTMQIDPAQSTEFVVPLPNGRYLLDVTAYYADIEGSSATVSNVFAVDIGQAVASNPTPEATEAATPETTPEVTPEVTEVATEATTPEATVEATVESTEEPTVEATPEATEATVEPTIEPTAEETEDAGTSGGNATETPEATEESVEPTAEATEAATEPVTTEEAATAEATKSATPVTPVATTPEATEEVTVPTATPTEIVTEEPTEVVTEVSAPPTATSTPTATPTRQPTSTSTPVPTGDVPPAVTFRVSGRNYQPVGYDYCEPNTTGELECVKQPLTTTGSTSIRVARNAAANIRIAGPRPTSIEINYLSRDTLQPIATETRPGDNVVLFNLGVAAGSYVLSVEVTWSDVVVTYYFQLQVLQ